MIGNLTCLTARSFSLAAKYFRKAHQPEQEYPFTNLSDRLVDLASQITVRNQSPIFQMAVDAVRCELVSTIEVSGNREIYREFREIRHSTAIFVLHQRLNSMLSS